MRVRLTLVVAGIALWMSALSAQNLPSVNAPGVPAQMGAIRLNSPKMDERIRQDFVRVQYELTNPGVAASPSPTFMVRLDDRDPVTTATTEQMFTGLTPGNHSVSVTLVDANGVPIQGSSVTARFTVLNSGSVDRPSRQSGPPQDAANPSSPTSSGGLPANNSALPILSVIGFGVLVGGIFSAMRGR